MASKLDTARAAVAALPDGVDVWPPSSAGSAWVYCTEGDNDDTDWDAVAGIGAGTVRKALRESDRTREHRGGRGRLFFHVRTTAERMEIRAKVREQEAAEAGAATLVALGAVGAYFGSAAERDSTVTSADGARYRVCVPNLSGGSTCYRVEWI